MKSTKRARMLALILSFILALDLGAVRAAAETDAAETDASSETAGAYGAGVFLDTDMVAASETLDELTDPDSGDILAFAPGIDTAFVKNRPIVAPATAADLRRELESEAEMTEEELADQRDRYDRVGTIAVAKTSLALNIRANPDSDAEVVGKLYQGSGAIYGGEKGTWTYVTSGDVSGWAASRYILSGTAAEKFYAETVPQVAFPTTDNLSVRKEASTESDLMTRIGRGSCYPVLGVEGNWVLIQITSHEQGYVSAEYVTVTKGLCTAKTAMEDEAMTDGIAKLEAERQAALEKARQEAEKAKEKERSGNGGNSSKKDNDGGNSSKKDNNDGGNSSKKDDDSSKDDEGSGSMKGWTKVGTCRLSSYCKNCNSPRGYATYTGVKAVEWKTVAVDPNVIPLGSTVYIDGYGTFKAQDIGVSGKWIDLFVNPDECSIWAKATVYYK